MDKVIFCEKNFSEYWHEKFLKMQLLLDNIFYEQVRKNKLLLIDSIYNTIIKPNDFPVLFEQGIEICNEINDGYELIVYKIPFSGNAEFLYLKPHQYIPVEALIREQYIILKYQILNLHNTCVEIERINDFYLKDLNCIKTNLDNLNHNYNELKNDILMRIKEYIYLFIQKFEKTNKPEYVNSIKNGLLEKLKNNQKTIKITVYKMNNPQKIRN